MVDSKSNVELKPGLSPESSKAPPTSNSATLPGFTSLPRFTRSERVVPNQIVLNESDWRPINQQRSSAETKATPAKQTGSSSKQLVKKIVKPIRATLVELGHPFELLKSAQRFIWPKSPSSEFDDYLASRSLAGHVFELNLNHAPTYSLIKKAPIIASDRMSVDQYIVPRRNESLDSPITNNTTTQLQVRMSDDWIMLYEVNRTTSIIDHDNIGVGLGLRYAF